MSDLNKLYRELDKHSPRHLFLFPLVSGLAWFVTLSVLLIYWLSIGRPSYPGQINPYIAFISDIAAFHLKPFFIVGCTITSITYIGTVFSVHYARHSTRFFGLPGTQSSGSRFISTVTLVAGVASGVCLFLLALFDTVQEHERHMKLLLTAFGGLIITALGMGVVLADVRTKVRGSGVGRRERVGGTKSTEKVRVWCVLNFVLMLAIAVLGISFVVALRMRWMMFSGIVEWVIAYVGALWLLSFVGFLIHMHVEPVGVDEESDHEDEDESEHGDVEYMSTEDDQRPLLGISSDRIV